MSYLILASSASIYVIQQEAEHVPSMLLTGQIIATRERIPEFVSNPNNLIRITID